jgi:tRNA (mo5U34)-methyltransferase
MDIEAIRQEREEWKKWKNIAPLYEMIDALPSIEANLTIDDAITLTTNGELDQELIHKSAKQLMPWRKGPWQVFDTYIDSEWQSQKKFNLLKPYMNLKDRVVGDIGCNNGYYMFRMLELEPKVIIGFDPAPTMKAQFDFINHFAKTDIEYELLGVEHLPHYPRKFDTLFCLGVLYHRHNPIETVKQLYKGLNSGGELFIDTFMIDGDEEVALTPLDRYSKMSNVYFIPTIPAFKNWLYRAGFDSVEVLEIVKTDLSEQRKTKWIVSESLNNFLDLEDESKTIEGYPAPKRVYVKATKQ